MTISPETFRAVRVTDDVYWVESTLPALQAVYVPTAADLKACFDAGEAVGKRLRGQEKTKTFIIG